MTTVRARIEAAPLARDRRYYLADEWRAGNLIPVDEAEARIAEAVAAERLRAERLCQALRYRMNASDFDQLIVAIRGGNHDG